jgi:hypothetical protein
MSEEQLNAVTHFFSSSKIDIKAITRPPMAGTCAGIGWV